MSKLLPGNIIYGGEVTCKESSNYRSAGHFVLEKLKQIGDEITLIDALSEREYSGRQIYTAAVSLAQVLQHMGIKSGDVIATSCENRFEFAIILYAGMAINVTVAPLNITYTKREIHHAINLSKPKAIFVREQLLGDMIEVAEKNSFVKILVNLGDAETNNNVYKFKDLLENRQGYAIKPCFEFPAAKNIHDDVAIIVCSSGTTGLPKGVQLTQSNIMHLLDTNLGGALIPSGATLLSVIPWFHAFGCLTLMIVSALGQKMVFLPHFEEKLFLGAIEKYRVMVLLMVPPLMVFLAKHPLVDNYDLSSILALICGAAPLSKETESQVRERIGVPIIRQGYGLSETTLAVLTQSDEASSPGSVGEVKPGVWAKVIDPETGATLGPNQRGELCFKGECIMKGYIGDISATATTIRDGWLHTGDIGYYSESLEFFIVDRIKELIKYKGFQVPPAEIESLLLTHPDISDAAVIGRPDEAAGELPMAFVVKQKNSKLTADEVTQFVKKQASPAKQLRGGVVFIDAIPKNPSGKILRRVLRDMLKGEQNKQLSKL